MGIKGFFKVFGSSSTKFNNKEYNGSRVGVDASCEIYRASLGAMNVLTSGGENTALYNILLQSIVSYRVKFGVRGLIYIFDHPDQNPMKIEENKKRRESRKKCALRTDSKHKKDKFYFKITGEIIDNVKTLLNLLGVAWVVAPKGYEAEHMGAHLSKIGIIDIFVTGDSDALTFGTGNILVRERKSGRATLKLYNLKKILDDFNLDMESFVHICVVMGTDFAPKTPRIGVKTILKKGPEAELTLKQETAKKYFLSECPFDLKWIHKESFNKEELIKWLVEKEFNIERLEKMLVGY